MIIKKISVNKMAILAVIFVILIGMGGAGIWIYDSPCVYVSLQASPEVAYTLNRFDYVLKVEVLGDNSQVLGEKLQKAGLNNKKIEAALQTTLDMMSEQQSLAGDGILDIGNMVVSVSCENLEKQKDLTNTLNILLLTYEWHPKVEIQETDEGAEPLKEDTVISSDSRQTETAEELEKAKMAGEKPVKDSEEIESESGKKANLPEESQPAATFTNSSQTDTSSSDASLKETDSSALEEPNTEEKISPSDSLESQVETTAEDRAREKLESQAAKLQSKQESLAEKIRKKTGR